MRIRRELSPAERLAVAADFKPAEWGGRRGVREKVVKLAKDLKGSGVTFKVNTILRAVGYDLLDEISDQGLVPWADLKLSDTKDTNASDLEFLAEVKVPRLLVTVKCDVGGKNLRHLVARVPDRFELIGITVLSDMSEDECLSMFESGTESTILYFAQSAGESKLGGIVCSGGDVGRISDGNLPDNFTFNTPNIRPAWAPVKDDGQNKARAATIAEALGGGADRVVIGRPITGQADPHGAVMRCLEEINEFYARLRA